MRIIELHIIPDEDGWVKLPENLLQALRIRPGDMLSFYADGNGFRVEGTKKPPYFHASTERHPVALGKFTEGWTNFPSFDAKTVSYSVKLPALQASMPETHAEPPTQTIFTAPQHEDPTPLANFTDATQQQLFDPG